MKRFACSLFLLLLLLGFSQVDGQAKAVKQQPKTSVVETSWGKIVNRHNGTGLIELRVKQWNSSRSISLPTPFANITSAYYQQESNREHLRLKFNSDATSITLQLPQQATGEKPEFVLLETAEGSKQFADGRIAFSALDAEVIGDKAQLETHPGNHRIGFWTNSDDYVRWHYIATRPGMYLVQLTYSLAGGQGSTIGVEYAGKTITKTIQPTGSWYQYRTISLGKIYLEKTGKQMLTVKCLKKTGGACMNLKAVSLLPTCEGKPIVQAEDGTVLCHARDVTIHGVKVQYEPRPIKNTVGYWVVESDWVSWEFTLNKPGRYEVEILQGCGTGHGGSQVELSVDDQPLPFVVEDTGHFQNFKPRTIGSVRLDKAGRHRISVKPIHLQVKAVMDLRQVRLVPKK